MKTLKALVATAILASSTLAAAQPAFRDHRYDDHSSQRYRERRGPIMLAQNLELDRRQPAFIRLDGRTSQLRFDADDGRVFIDSVVMRFADGRTQTVSIRQRLNDRSRPVTINVSARATGVYVYGTSRRGSLDIVGIRNARW